jgi:hypothetical protein
VSVATWKALGWTSGRRAAWTLEADRLRIDGAGGVRGVLGWLWNVGRKEGAAQ